MSEEAAETGTITGTRHVLAVPDLDDAVAWYGDALGFELVWQIANQWALMRRGRACLMMGECPDEIPPQRLGDHAYFAYFEVDDALALFEELKGRGASFRNEIEDKPWGQREFAVQSPAGHRIMFGQPLE